jgi:hypothetical protein
MLKLRLDEKHNIVNLKDHKGRSYREISREVGIPKSTLHDNTSKFRAEIDAWIAASSVDHVQTLIRVVLILSLNGQCSSRNVGSVILQMWRVTISHQTVLEILNLASIAAKKLNNNLDLSKIKSAIFDEIFQKNIPLLVFADPFSGVIYAQNLLDRSGDSWTFFLEALKLLGLDPDSVTTDGGSGLLKALGECFKQAVTIRDLFHVLKKLSKALRIMEGKCYSFIIMTDILKNKGKNEEAKEMEDQFNRAVKIFSRLENLFIAFKKATSFESSDGVYVNASDLKRLTIEIVAELKEFYKNINQHKAINEARSYLENGIDGIVSYKTFIEIQIEKKFGKAYREMVLSFICPLIEYIHHYLKSHDSKVRKEYWAKKIAELRSLFRNHHCINQNEIDNAINTVWAIGLTASKSNSYIEAVNSVIRVHLQTYKSIPSWFPELFTYYWNNRSFKRGKRANFTPVQLLTGVKNDKDWIDEIIKLIPLEQLRSELPIILTKLKAA